MARVKYTGLHGTLSKLKYKELKAGCIMMGMDFDDVHEADVHKLQTYYMQHHGEKMDSARLEQFEDYTTEVLVEQGMDPDDVIATFRPFTGNNDTEAERSEEVGKPNTAIIKKAGGRKTKDKKKKDGTFNIFTGTKKAMVYELTKEGVNIKKIIKKTLKQFPEAAEKSIKIWNKRALKDLANA